MNYDCLPNFYIIGAAKCGTTTLYDVLKQHNSVYMPLNKEPNYFCNQNNYFNGVDSYIDKYFKNTAGYKARGEGSTHYLYWSEIASRRMAQVYGKQNFRTIAIFRDPVKRAYSHYWMMVRRKVEDLSFENALKAENERLKSNYDKLVSGGSQMYGYFRGGMFATLLKPFLDQFPRENLYCVLMDDLINDFAYEMERISIFLGINDGFRFKLVDSNSASIPRSKKLDLYLRNPSGAVFQAIKLILGRFDHDLRIKIRKKIVGLNKKPSSNPPMDKNIEKKLRIDYFDEIEKLERIMNKDLGNWKIKNE